MTMHVTLDACHKLDPRAVWNRGLDAFHKASDDYERHQLIFRPISDQLDRIAPYPGCSVEVESRNGQVASFSLLPADLHALDDHPVTAVRVKAAELRGLWLAHRAARKELGYDTASDESDRLCTAMCEREGEMLEMPAPDREVLMWKLERLFGPDVRKEGDYSDSWCPMWINALMDDARRLIGASVGISPLLELAIAA